jgi:hypothetical protein
MEDKKVPTRINAELIYYQLAEIKTQLQDFKANYVTKEESAALKAEINELRKDIKDIKKSKNIIGWLYPTLTAVVTAVFTYLVIEYLKKGK